MKRPPRYEFIKQLSGKKKARLVQSGKEKTLKTHLKNSREQAALVAKGINACNRAAKKAVAELGKEFPDPKILQNAERKLEIEIWNIGTVLDILSKAIPLQGQLFGAESTANLSKSYAELGKQLKLDNRVLKEIKQAR